CCDGGAVAIGSVDRGRKTLMSPKLRRVGQLRTGWGCHTILIRAGRTDMRSRCSIPRTAATAPCRRPELHQPGRRQHAIPSHDGCGWKHGVYATKLLPLLRRHRMEDAATGTTSLLQKDTGAVKETLALALYLYICIGAVVLLKSAVLRDVGVDIAIW